MRQHVASFANFICRFGEDATLIDYADTIVVPAFLDNALVRSYGNTNFFLYEVELVTLDKSATPPILGLAGRFVKDTELSREQLFDRRKGLVKNAASLRSSPSAFFVLILNNHRLVYLPETANAPSLDMFRSTVIWLMKRKHRAFIDDQSKRLKESGERTSKRKLLETHPGPTLEVIPISGNEEIANFVRRYDILKRITFRLIRTNDEIDGKELFDEVREYLGSDLNAKNTKVTVANPAGLDVEATISRVEAATSTDNQEVTLSGIDEDGNELRGDNNEFRVSSPLDSVPPSRSALTRKLFGLFRHLQEIGVIRVGHQARNISDHISRLRNLF